MARPSEPMSTALNAELNSKDVAHLFGMTINRLSQLETDGTLHRNSNGKFVLDKVVGEWTQYLRSRSSSARIDDDRQIRQLRIESMKSEQAERARKLVPLDWVKSTLLDMVGKLSARIKSFPVSYTRDMKERAKMQKILDDVLEKFVKDLDGLQGEAADMKRRGRPRTRG